MNGGALVIALRIQFDGQQRRWRITDPAGGFMFVMDGGTAAFFEDILHREGLHLHALAHGCRLRVAAAPFATERLTGIVEEYAPGQPARKSPGRRARGLYELAVGSDAATYQYRAYPGRVLQANITPIVARYFPAAPPRLYVSVSMD